MAICAKSELKSVTFPTSFCVRMLDDRPYMRRLESGAVQPVWLILIIVHTLCFVLQQINTVYVGLPAGYLLLSPEGIGRGYVWQLITYALLHGNFLHFLLNMVMLWMFGRHIEEVVGKKKFISLYVLSIIAGGCLQVLLGVVFPRFFGFPTLGASAGVSALIAAFCALDPNAEIRLMLILPVRARHLLYFEMAVALFFTIVPSERGIAHAAHLGGILFALAFVRWGLRSEPTFNWRPFHQEPKPRELVRAAPAKRTPWKRAPKPEEDLPPAEFISKEVDPILDKISAHGIQSLTERERQILEAARKKMSKR